MPNLTPKVCPQLEIISTFGILFRILTPYYWAHYSRYDCWARLSRLGELHVDPDEKWTVRRLFITADGDGRSVAEPSIASSLRVNWPIVVIYDRTTRMPQGVTPRRFTPFADAYFPPLLPSVRRLSAVSGGSRYVARPTDTPSEASARMGVSRAGRMSRLSPQWNYTRLKRRSSASSFRRRRSVHRTGDCFQETRWPVPSHPVCSPYSLRSFRIGARANPRRKLVDDSGETVHGSDGIVPTVYLFDVPVLLFATAWHQTPTEDDHTNSISLYRII